MLFSYDSSTNLLFLRLTVQKNVAIVNATEIGLSNGQRGVCSMQKYQELKVLSYVKKDVQSVFQGENTPKLLYVGKTRPAASAHPRIMHSHQDFLEMVLIVSGSGEYFIHDKVCHVEAGDLLIYNSGVVHDEFAGNKIEIGSYCIAISGIHMPGLRRDALISDDCDQVFSCGDAENILAAECVVLIGTHDHTHGMNCGHCGFATCEERFEGVPCAINTVDVGIAIGSACAVAADHRVDTRVMFSAGLAAQQLDWLDGCTRVFAIPVSASSKNPFFDRKPITVE